MKKKIYFGLTTIIIIIGAIISIINCNQLVQQLIADAQGTGMEDIYIKNGHAIIWISSIIVVIINLYVFNTAMNNKIMPKKGILIFLFIICLLLSLGILIEVIPIISIANVVVLAFLKRKNAEDYPEKREIPRLEYKKPTKKELIWSILLVCTYFSEIIIERFLEKNVNFNIVIAITIIYYISLLVISIFAFKSTIKEHIKLFKENNKGYLQFIFSKFVFFFIIYMATNVLCTLINGGEISINQQTIESIPLWISAILAILWAPIVEEAVFRGSLRRFFKNDTIFIIISAILFGFMHVILEPTIKGMIIMGIPYAVMGGYFAYIYAKSKNMVTNIFSHMLVNIIGIILMSISIATVLL